MLRKVLLALIPLALLLALVAPVWAVDPATDDQPGLMGRAFQAVVAAEVPTDGKTLTVKNGSISAEDIVLNTEGVQVKVPGGFKLESKYQPVTMLKVGDRVAVKLETAPEDGQLTNESNLKVRALHLIPGLVFVHLTGVIETASESEVVLTTAEGNMTCAADGDETVVAVKKARESLADFGPDNLEGKKATVIARKIGDDYSALSIVLHGNGNDPDGDVEDVDAADEDDEDDGNNGQGKALGRDKDKPNKNQDKDKVNKPNKPDNDDDDNVSLDNDDDDDDKNQGKGQSNGKGKGLTKNKDKKA